jgi:tRNA-dihydrouridine synthase B
LDFSIFLDIKLAMNKTFWSDLADKWPISSLAPMDGYTDSPYRQIVKKISPETVVFSEFYSADGLVHSKDLQKKALSHNTSEYPLIIQIFGKDPNMFREAAKIIESYGITGIDINMWCPAKKVVKSGHGSSLMINRDTAFKIVEEMAKAVKIPISVKTRLGWEDPSLLIDFAKWLENAGANLISVHGRTYKQAFTWSADFTGIYELKQHLWIPVICNGDILSYDDWIQKIIHPENRLDLMKDSTMGIDGVFHKNLDGFMIGRASFGNPWCFVPGGYEPTLGEILDVMQEHGELLWQCKERKWMMEARKHLVQYLHGFPWVKTYRSSLVHVENVEDIIKVLDQIKIEHASLLSEKISTYNPENMKTEWWCGVD